MSTDGQQDQRLYQEGDGPGNQPLAALSNEIVRIYKEPAATSGGRAAQTKILYAEDALQYLNYRVALRVEAPCALNAPAAQ